MNVSQKKGIIESSFMFLVISFFLLSPVLVFAGEQGYMITKDNETILDQKGDTSITWQNKIWFTEEKVRIENTQDKHRVLLIDMVKGKLYQLDTQEKTYRIIEFPEGLKDLYEKGTIKSQEMNQKKKCGEWDCYGIKVTTRNKDVSLDTEYWMAKDVNVPITLRKKIAKYFGPDQIKLTEELAKYKGYPVQTVLNMKAHDKEIKMTSNVREVKKMDIEPKIFAIPDDFKALDDIEKKVPIEEKEKDLNMKDPNIEKDKSIKQ